MMAGNDPERTLSSISSRAGIELFSEDWRSFWD